MKPITHYFELFEREAFRLELLPHYEIPESADRLEFFLQGAPLPPTEPNEWADFLRTATAGKHVRRVHILPETLTPYLRYEIEWGYCYHAAAGEEIYLIQKRDVPAGVRSMAQFDFWLFDEAVALQMNYDQAGRFLGHREISDKDLVRELCRVRQLLLATAMPLRAYLAALRNA